MSYLLKSLQISVYQYPISGSWFLNSVTELDWFRAFIDFGSDLSIASVKFICVWKSYSIVIFLSVPYVLCKVLSMSSEYNNIDASVHFCDTSIFDILKYIRLDLPFGSYLSLSDWSNLIEFKEESSGDLTKYKDFNFELSISSRSLNVLRYSFVFPLLFSEPSK